MLQSGAPADTISRFQEAALDVLDFPDDAMANYFSHVSTLLNLELAEAIGHGDAKNAEIGLITHKRQIDAAALLCKKGSMVRTPPPAIVRPRPLQIRRQHASGKPRVRRRTPHRRTPHAARRVDAAATSALLPAGDSTL